MNPGNPSPETRAAPPVRTVPADAVWRWFALGWRDLKLAGGPSLMHGILVSVVSMVIVAITLMKWELLPGAVSGFLLTGPFLATGLYALSRKLETGASVSLRDALQAWRNGSRCLFRFSLLLIAAASLWVLFSVAMFHLFIDDRISNALDFLRYVLTQDNLLFMLWTILGGLGSALAFAATVVAMPMLVERDVNTPMAIEASIRAVGHNPIAMLWWALAILVVTALSFATLMLGFIVLYPLLGHASWHVYRDLVDASDLPLRSTTG